MKTITLLIASVFLLNAEPAVAKLSTGSDSIVIHSLGHASLMFEYNNLIIHIDPYSSQANYDLLPDADIVLITHQHGDHYDVNALNKIKNDSTKMVLTKTVSDLGTYSGTKTILYNWDSAVIKEVNIKAVPAYNLVNSTNHVKGVGNGYIVTLGEKRIYIAGDTEDIPEMDSLGAIDIAFIPMNLPFTMTPEQAAVAAKKVNPEILYIYHFGNSDTAKLRNLLNNEDLEIRIGKSVYIERADRSDQIPNSLNKNINLQAEFFPNPVKDYIRIYFPQSPDDVYIYDLNGRLLHRIKISGDGEQQINLGFLSPGTYLFSVVNKDQSRYERLFVKE